MLCTQKNRSPYIRIFIWIFVCVGMQFLVSPKLTEAAVDNSDKFEWIKNITGYAWNPMIGWISLSCENDSSCGTVDYGIAVALPKPTVANPNPDYIIVKRYPQDLTNGWHPYSGHVWNPSTGFIGFYMYTKPPASEISYTYANVAMSHAHKLSPIDVHGYANLSYNYFSPDTRRISLSSHIDNPSADGVIPYGVTLENGKLGGWAWSPAFGWISFSCENTDTCTGASGVPYGGTFTQPCTPSNVCSSDHTSVVSTNEWCSVATTTCNSGNICSDTSNSCVLDVPTGTISVVPNKLRADATATVEWTATNYDACEISGTNGNAWSWSSTSPVASALITSPVASEVVYTLNCRKGAGAMTAVAEGRVSLVPSIKQF